MFMVTKQEFEGFKTAYNLDESGKQKDSWMPFDGCCSNFSFKASLRDFIL